jgi:hypothetical protein
VSMGRSALARRATIYVMDQSTAAANA